MVGCDGCDQLVTKWDVQACLEDGCELMLCGDCLDPDEHDCEAA